MIIIKANLHACQECTGKESCYRRAAPASLQLLVGMTIVTHLLICPFLFEVGFYAEVR